MKKALLTLPVAALLLAGCSGTPQSSPTAPTVEPIGSSSASAASTPAPTSSKSARGNIVKQFGQGANITDTQHDNKEIVNFTVNSIAPATCTGQYAQPAENGHLIAVDIAAETKPELAEAVMTSYHLSPSSFKFVADNGTTYNGNLGTAATFSCLPDPELFPSAGLGPGEKAAGKIVIDVPAPSGILVLKAPGSSTNGWEYKF
ncbi:hypothetical protein ACTHQ6_09390 [Arthrobacter sp. SAFR-179]|uniref:hypothetical protein n=1 Tax=Arthrobacter sp. SAFR-179 TaxID=3387279 RepID=UPI003F7BD424